MSSKTDCVGFDSWEDKEYFLLQCVTRGPRKPPAFGYVKPKRLRNRSVKLKNTLLFNILIIKPTAYTDFSNLLRE